MQAAAKARWGADLKEDEADAAWAGAFALDTGLFACIKVEVIGRFGGQVLLHVSQRLAAGAPCEFDRAPDHSVVDGTDDVLGQPFLELLPGVGIGKGHE